MTYRCKIGTERDIENLLNNALVLGPVPANSNPIGGLTLIFNTPAATVTFPGSAGAHVTVPQMVVALSAVSGLIVQTVPLGGNNAGGADYGIVIYRAAGLVIDSAGTANAALGLSTSVDTTKAAPLDPAKVIAVSPGSIPGHYLLVYEDS